MNNQTENTFNSNEDDIVHGMDWGANELKDFELSNYRKYQFDLIGKHIGKNILEVGSGDRSFTNQIVKNVPGIERIISIEPSPTLMEVYKDKYKLPDYVVLSDDNLFHLTPDSYGLFDTIILIHVLEHVEKDREALTHLHSLLKPGGKVLIEVPAMQSLFSVHDKMLGHYRRYNKTNFRAMVDPDLYKTKDLWYQDAIGMIGSFIFFKLKKIELKSDKGVDLVKNQGKFYDKYLIPFEKFYEKLIRLPFGLSITGVLEKKQPKI
ncbi:MAG: class I SAM-dependent methyltransferase [Bacteroidetes bacterium]|nr:class I SAM-dependent methyltransferase [Bacteroidota bacterium]